MRIAIVHPWLPEYRLPFFRELIQRCKTAGMDVDVYCGTVPPNWRLRQDECTADFIQPLKTTFVRLGPWTLISRDIGSLVPKYDAFVLEHALRNVETYRLLFFTRNRPKVAFWGHGRDFARAQSGVFSRAKAWILHRADWFFAYTEGGAVWSRQAGFPASRVTVVRNALDTSELRTQLERIGQKDLADFVSAHGLTSRTALFIGALDRGKGIEFLIRASDMLALRDPEFRLLIVGDGPLREYVAGIATKRPWLVAAGRLSGESKALALKAAKVIVAPSRVGLVAVDALAADLPIISTEGAKHGPEFEYLQPGKDVFICPADAQLFGALVEQVISAVNNQETGAASSHQAGEIPSIEDMVDRFLAGLMAWEHSHRRSSATPLGEHPGEGNRPRYG